jgi:hypothetical protein
MVALLLKAEDKDDIRAAIMTAIIRPTRPVGNTFSTSLVMKGMWLRLHETISYLLTINYKNRRKG